MEEDDSVYPLVLRRTADALADRLEARVNRLRSDAVCTDDVVIEIRRQISSCSLDDPLASSDLADLLLELLWARENIRRAV